MINGQRHQIEERNKEWARADVGTLSSFANMEGLLKREYYGRFIIELIQNARDAWYASGKKPKEKSIVRVILHGEPESPVLTVCNQGVSFNAERLLKHITQFGESSKISGEGIGHKGIGFKSVLEITRTPEIYSREYSGGPFSLCVGFDPRKSEQLIKEANNGRTWGELVKEYDKGGLKSKEQRLPVLRFPQWIDVPCGLVTRESTWNGIQFNTLIRLPYDLEYDSILGITRESWLNSVRTAMDDVSDEIVMLLDAFDQVILEDHIGMVKTTCITAKRGALQIISDTSSCHRVSIFRNEKESSDWLLYRKLIDNIDSKKLSHEITIGIKCEDSNGRLIPIEPEDHARCFHLFFPTRIDSKLPFLFHAYFEVDAGRTRFALDAQKNNSHLLDELTELFITAIEDLINKDKKNEFSIIPLPALFQAAGGDPDDPQTTEFRDKLLNKLDKLPWISVEPIDGRATGKSTELLLHNDPEICHNLASVFSAEYAWKQGKFLVPHNGLGKAGLSFVASRLGDYALTLETLKTLLQPGRLHIWSKNENEKFVELLVLINKLHAMKSELIVDLVKGLRGSDDSRLIPIPTKDAGIRFVSLPSEVVRGKGKTDLAVFARLKQKTEIDLLPPECLKVEFIKDGVLTDELLSGPGRLLGIREYAVDSILDRLNTGEAKEYEEYIEVGVLNFVWQLLLKAEVGSYSIKLVLRKIDAFFPGNWWWCHPDGFDESDKQRRIKSLNNVLLPTKGGEWVAAEKLVFGKEWADWFSQLGEFGVHTAMDKRKSSFELLEQLAPDDNSIVAGPDTLSELLSFPSIEWDDIDLISLPENPADKHFLLMFCFLQCLGVWEIMPVNGFSDNTVRETKDPWEGKGPRNNHWKNISKVSCEFNNYGRDKSGHKNIYVVEDFDWAWNLQSTESFLKALSIGYHFYDKLKQIKLSCHGCQSHKQWYPNSKSEPQPSLLLWRLREERWLLCTVSDGIETSCCPKDIWWERNIPDSSRMRTSPLRFLPIARNINAEVAQLCGLRSLESIDIEGAENLLSKLYDDYISGVLNGTTPKDSSFRQAFIGLHQRLYSRLREICKKEIAQDCIAKVGVLCTQGDKLIWEKPETCWFDDGKFAAYKHHFIGDIPFCILSRSDEDIAVASFLVISPFKLKIERSDSGPPTNVTANFPIFHNRLVELFALLVYYKIGAFSLTIDGKEFPLRLQRVKNLRIFQVEDLYLELSVVDSPVPFLKTIGKGNNGDLYLDRKKVSHPVIYHDYTERGWPELLRSRIAPYIAELIENNAYSDAISLLYQCSDADLPYFLNERGVSDHDLDTIRVAFGQSNDALRKQAQTWWTAILELLQIPHQPLQDENIFPEVSEIIQRSHFPQGFKEKLLGFSDVEHAREDAYGLLSFIESERYSLEELHFLLRKKGDPGLTIQNVWKKIFYGWLNEYGKELAFTLTKKGVLKETAKKIGRSWEIPTSMAFQVKITLVQIMEPFAKALNNIVGLTESPFEALQLSNDPLEHFSILCGESEQELSDNSKLLYDENEQQRIHNCNYAELKKRLALFITIIKTTPAFPSFSIREIHQSVLDEVTTCIDVDALCAKVKSICGEDSSGLALYLYFMEILGADLLLAMPGQEKMREEICRRCDITYKHMSYIQDTLIKTNRQNIDRMRRKINVLEKAEIILKPYQGTSVSRPQKKKISGQKNIKPLHVEPKNQRHLTKLGSDAEQWVMAALLNKFELLRKHSFDEFQSVLGLLGHALEVFYKGESVIKLIACKDRAILVDIDEDDRMEALSNFIHLSKESDSFGCDVLGWIPSFEGEAAMPLFLEVKSDSDRSFNVSENEWNQAERLGESYAFMVVLRSKDSVPQGFELLPNPQLLLTDDKISIEPDGRIVSYTKNKS